MKEKSKRTHKRQLQRLPHRRLRLRTRALPRSHPRPRQRLLSSHSTLEPTRFHHSHLFLFLPVLKLHLGSSRAESDDAFSQLHLNLSRFESTIQIRLTFDSIGIEGNEAVHGVEAGEGEGDELRKEREGNQRRVRTRREGRKERDVRRTATMAIRKQ